MGQGWILSQPQQANQEIYGKEPYRSLCSALYSAGAGAGRPYLIIIWLLQLLTWCLYLISLGWFLSLCHPAILWSCWNSFTFSVIVWFLSYDRYCKTKECSCNCQYEMLTCTLFGHNGRLLFLAFMKISISKKWEWEGWLILIRIAGLRILTSWGI